MVPDKALTTDLKTLNFFSKFLSIHRIKEIMKSFIIKSLTLIYIIFMSCSIIHAADSKSNRGEGIVSFGASFGLLYWGNLTSPITIAVPGEEWTFGFEYGSRNFKTDSTSSGIKSEGSFNITDMGLFARYYYGNSFNSIFALNSMDSKMEVFATNQSTGATASGELSTSAIRFTAGIGNEWTLDWGLVIGADWLTGSTLLTQTVDASVNESSGSIDTSDTKESSEDLGKMINLLSAIPGIVVFRIGYSF